MLKRIFWLAAFACLCLSYARADTPPSKETVEAWWKAKSEEKMDVIGELIEIRLQSKEVAYLVEVAFARGRNDMFHIAMVRPRLKEVREVDEPVAKDVKVYDLNRDGISEVVAESVGSGQGTFSGVKAIVQFDEWTLAVLHQIDFYEGGFEEGQSSCSSKSVRWKFVDLNKDGTLDLVEDITIAEGTGGKPCVTSRQKYMYLFKGSEFVNYYGAKRASKKKPNG